MRIVKEQEDKFDVDSDWVMPQLAELLPDGGRLDHEVRKLDNTYFDTPGAGLRVFGITLRVLTLLSDRLGVPLRYLEEIPGLRREGVR